jgi:hypothetical protein
VLLLLILLFLSEMLLRHLLIHLYLKRQLLWIHGCCDLGWDARWQIILLRFSMTIVVITGIPSFLLLIYLLGSLCARVLGLGARARTARSPDAF